MLRIYSWKKWQVRECLEEAETLAEKYLSHKDNVKMVAEEGIEPPTHGL